MARDTHPADPERRHRLAATSRWGGGLRRAGTLGRSLIGAVRIGAVRIGAVLIGATMLTTACGSGPPSKMAARSATTATRPAPGPAGTTDPSKVAAGAATTTTQPGPGTTGSSDSSGTSAAVKFAQCMRSHGVPDFPDPSPSGGFDVKGLDPNSPTVQAAQRACEKADPGGSGIPTGAERAQDLTHLLHYAECMRAHGVVDFPDPSTTPGGGVGFKFMGNVDENSPAFAAADRICHHLLPAGGEGHHA